jgi:hypothetical protein
MIDTPNLEERLPPFVRALPGFNKYVVGGTLICYVTGFVITNLFLGSLGVVSLDVLRVKYVLTGLLFLIFLGVATFLVYGFLRTLRKYHGMSNAGLLFEIVVYSLMRFGFLVILASTLDTLAGISSKPPIGIPGVSPPSELSLWLQDVPHNLVLQTSVIGFTLLIVLLPILLVGLIVIAINSNKKDGMRASRRDRLAKAVSYIAQPVKIGRILAVIFLMLAFLTGLSLLNFISTNRVGSQPSPAGLSGGWLRFVGGAFLLYVMAAIFMLVPRSEPSERSENAESEATRAGHDPTQRYASWIVTLAVIIGLVVPLYALGIYPSLPQQIGGGMLVSVEIMSASAELQESFSDPATEVYLLDRSSSRSIFLFVNEQQQTQKIMEVANSQIQSITYQSFP